MSQNRLKTYFPVEAAIILFCQSACAPFFRPHEMRGENVVVKLLDDVEFRNNIKIRFPVNFTIDNLNFSLRLLENSELNKPKILDLRIPNKVITYD